MAARVGGATFVRKAGATSVAITYTPTAGHGMVVVVGTNSAVTVTSITQTNCTWTFVSRKQVVGGAFPMSVETWYCGSAGASPGGTVTINFSASTLYTCANVEEYDTALNTVGQPDGTTASNSGGATSTIGAGTAGSTTVAPDLLVGAYYAINTTTIFAVSASSASNGFAVTQNANGVDAIGGESYGSGIIDKIQTGATTTPNTTITLTNACDNYVSQICALSFSGAVAPGGNNQGLMMMGIGA